MNDDGHNYLLYMRRRVGRVSFFLCFRLQVRENYSCIMDVRNSVVTYLLLQYVRESRRRTYAARTTMRCTYVLFSDHAGRVKEALM